MVRVIRFQSSLRLKWDHRLDVEHILDVVARPDTEVGVVLKRQADHVGYRILGGLGQRLRALTFRPQVAGETSDTEQYYRGQCKGGDYRNLHCYRLLMVNLSRCLLSGF